MLGYGPGSCVPCHSSFDLAGGRSIQKVLLEVLLGWMAETNQRLDPSDTPSLLVQPFTTPSNAGGGSYFGDKNLTKIPLLLYCCHFSKIEL